MNTCTRVLLVTLLIAAAGCASRPGDVAKSSGRVDAGEQPGVEQNQHEAQPSESPVALSHRCIVTQEEARRLWPKFTELFPGVRADLEAKVVEFDATVSPLLLDDPEAPLFFVETIVCSPDTREHESLLVTTVTPSHLHAAMLIAGLKPGSPGRFEFVNETFNPVSATGDRVSLRVLSSAPPAAAAKLAASRPAGSPGPLIDYYNPDPSAWLINVADRGKPEPRRFGSDEQDKGHGWVFAGSSMRKVPDKSAASGVSEVYDADGTGVVIGLCCFGSEVIAWSRTFSPDASINEPEWIADFTKTPPPGTPVRVRIQAAGQ